MTELSISRLAWFHSFLFQMSFFLA